MTKPRSFRYVGTLRGIRELGLVGDADLGLWRERMSGSGAAPIDVDGRAQVLVTGLASSWMGLAYREIAIAVSARQGEDREGYYFERAFNASRFFTFFEQRWFHTPYVLRPDVHIEGGTPGAPFRASLGEPGRPGFVAELAPRDPSRVEDVALEAPLLLPADGGGAGRWFHVKLEGRTESFDFDATRDRFVVGEPAPHPSLEALRTTGFEPREWQVRRSALHARTKTFGP